MHFSKNRRRDYPIEIASFQPAGSIFLISKTECIAFRTSYVDYFGSSPSFPEILIFLHLAFVSYIVF